MPGGRGIGTSLKFGGGGGGKSQNFGGGGGEGGRENCSLCRPTQNPAAVGKGLTLVPV